MIISVRVWLRMIKLILIFLVLSFLFYKMMGWLDVMTFPSDKYGTPEGSAVKAFHHDELTQGEGDSIVERLKMFYWYGE
ncbi:hypothetical protein J2Z69_000498 [Paenibacillus shirakamiensis]|uniref:DUF4227 family protein n=1 Tax=Paenibacillus shirakamiensis TaxID=1265935 RepID=A0ABS4JCM3_9BACL|nr:DUF4227 family protein [Paenibacillus shirakamiensis]MBP1999479.1 hypothetical protein [Paenibacillus shirakamiensis]